MLRVEWVRLRGALFFCMCTETNGSKATKVIGGRDGSYALARSPVTKCRALSKRL